MKRAVCILAFDEDYRVLTVSRRNDPHKRGLIGGKVDPGETCLEAAVREWYEETGVAIGADCLEPLYCAACPGETDYFCTTFIYTRCLPNNTQFYPEEGLKVEFLSKFLLMDRDVSPFALYNIGVFSALNQLES